jgi:hypothetical protein
MEKHAARVVTRMRRGTLLGLALLPTVAMAQDRLRTMPGYEQFQRMSPQIAGSVQSGALSVTWVDGGRAFEYTVGVVQTSPPLTNSEHKHWQRTGHTCHRTSP